MVVVVAAAAAVMAKAAAVVVATAGLVIIVINRTLTFFPNGNSSVYGCDRGTGGASGDETEISKPTLLAWWCARIP